MSFYYAVKTDKSHEHYTVIANGTKSQMQKLAKMLDANEHTMASHIVRERDGKIVQEYTRK